MWVQATGTVKETARTAQEKAAQTYEAGKQKAGEAAGAAQETAAQVRFPVKSASHVEASDWQRQR